MRTPTRLGPTEIAVPAIQGHLAPRMIHPERWIAVLRLVIGLWFLKSLFTKIELHWLGPIPIPLATERWVGFMPVRVEGWAEQNPIPWYSAFLHRVVTPNGEVFAHLTAYGEVLVGVGLTLGLLSGWAALGGLFLVGNYFLASMGNPLNDQGFHILLLAGLLALLATRAGRVAGIDQWLLRRVPRANRLPLV